MFVPAAFVVGDSTKKLLKTENFLILLEMFEGDGRSWRGERIRDHVV
jgi:hypothetical protein